MLNRYPHFPGLFRNFLALWPSQRMSVNLQKKPGKSSRIFLALLPCVRVRSLSYLVEETENKVCEGAKCASSHVDEERHELEP